MSESTRPASKAELLALIQTGYDRLEAFIAPLSEEQMTTLGTAGTWTIKDNLAHIAHCQDFQAQRQEKALAGLPSRELLPGFEDEDEENAYNYQQFKDRPFAEVYADLQASHRRIIAVTEALSWETLNKPFPGSGAERSILGTIGGNTYGHSDEHRETMLTEHE